ncbi:serine/threonine protein kinase [Actinocorallia sp. API 0066]|uniref:serine/threonine-protein kinase n=1 Tax=Actinocorallia sp. API 0066 TaxID=2896846 RepID=UPI001E55D70F|nr:serine/threonine-protein kinase [Actinocorallia sp. API 0066]MCD0453295.1 serine/threonine protein kinase [Actinocorallia sp. API 0066]
MGGQGEMLAGRFRVVAELGRGGMGVVWRGEDTELGREVAIKQVLAAPGLTGTAQAERRERMSREARAAARLSHPGAVTVYDVIRDDGGVLIVMEYVAAGSLQDLVEREGPLPVARVAQLGLAILDVLEAAHGLGIVHRDIKPANVLVPPTGVKLTDFGIARLEGEATLTAEGAVLGSPAYMAPEQVRGERAELAADLWGLGVTLYFAAEGISPFIRSNLGASLAAVLTEDPPLLARAPELEPLLFALLAKSPEERPDVALIRSELTALAAPSAGVTVLESAPSAFQTRLETPATVPPPRRTTLGGGGRPAPVVAPPSTRSRALVWRLLAAAALLAAAVLWVVQWMTVGLRLIPVGGSYLDIESNPFESWYIRFALELSKELHYLSDGALGEHSVHYLLLALAGLPFAAGLVAMVAVPRGRVWPALLAGAAPLTVAQSLDLASRIREIGYTIGWMFLPYFALAVATLCGAAALFADRRPRVTSPSRRTFLFSGACALVLLIALGASTWGAWLAALTTFALLTWHELHPDPARTTSATYTGWAAVLAVPALLHFTAYRLSTEDVRTTFLLISLCTLAALALALTRARLLRSLA